MKFKTKTRINPGWTAARSFLFLVTVLGALSVAPGGKAATLSDNFNDGNDKTPTIAWQRYDPISVATGGAVALGTWSFPGGNSYRLQSQASPDPGTYGKARIGSLAPGNFTNFYVAVEVVNWDATIHQIFGVLARAGTGGARDDQRLPFQLGFRRPDEPDGWRHGYCPD